MLFCSTDRVTHVLTSGLPGEMTPEAYAGKARDLLTLVANLSMGRG